MSIVPAIRAWAAPSPSKILPSDVAGDPGRRQRFEQEARAAAR